jgi:hypothetical protein
MQWKVVLPAPHDGVGEQPRSGQPALNRQLGRRRHRHDGLGVAQSPLADELGTADAHHDQRRGTALNGLADVLADALEGIEPFALDVVGQDLDLDARQVLGQRLTAGRLLALVLAHGLGRRCFVQHRPLAEQRRQHSHGQLRVAGAEPFGFLAEQAQLELAALLEHPQIKLTIVLPLGCEPFDVRAQ